MARTIRLTLVLLAMAVLLVGCAKSKRTVDVGEPLPEYIGPEFLRGTVGSLARLHGGDPILVTGIGFVTGLDGTGSNEVPDKYRQWIINEMNRGEIHKWRVNGQAMTPERALASQDTTLVEVSALIPAGASAGAPFDVYVKAIDSQTTSLQGGTLWTTSLSSYGAEAPNVFTHQLGVARGPLYIDPVRRPTSEELAPYQQQREAIVISGGVATRSRDLQLVLNVASWSRVRTISDRINEIFPKDPGRHARDPLADRFKNTAVAKDDLVIDLNIPKRYQGDAANFVAQVMRLYVQRGPNFEATQARKLGDWLAAHPEYVDDVIPAWQVLGKMALPVIRQYYEHEKLHVKLAALEAGARMHDTLAAVRSEPVAQAGDAPTRRTIARYLKYLPDSSQASKLLYRLLNDNDDQVRIAAYESMAVASDSALIRREFRDEQRLKFVMDLVPSNKPMIYISQSPVPRVVVFSPMLEFKTPMIAQMWDNRLMVKALSGDQPMNVYYQEPNGESGTYEVLPTVANFVLLLAHRTTVENPTPGFDLSFGQVVSVLSKLHAQHSIDAAFHVQVSPLARLINAVRNQADDSVRPETGGPEPMGQDTPTDGDGPGA